MIQLHVNFILQSTGYYEMGYPTSTTREGVQYNMSDGRFARTDNTSPVQASSISQQVSNYIVGN